MNRIILVLASVLCFSACTKKEAPAPVSLSAQEKKALVDSLGPSVSGKPAAGGDQITVINSNSYSQRGLTFDRYDKTTLRLKGFGLAPSVIVQGPQSLSTLPVTTQLRLQLGTVGAGGVDRNLGRSFTKGLDIYVIAKADGSGMALLATPTGGSPILPAGYTQKSEMLWFIAVFGGDIMRFRDVGNGECIYLNAPLTEKDFRFNKNDRSTTYLQMDPLVPVKASKATLEIVFFADSDLPPGSSLSFRTHRNNFDIFTYYPLINISQKQRQQFQFDVPVETSNVTSVDPINYAFSGSLLNSSSGASFTAVVKGWRLYKNY